MFCLPCDCYEHFYYSAIFSKFSIPFLPSFILLLLFNACQSRVPLVSAIKQLSDYNSHNIHYIQIYVYIYRAAAKLLLHIVQKITFINLRVLRRFTDTQLLWSSQIEHACCFPKVLGNLLPDLPKYAWTDSTLVPICICLFQKC